MNAKEGSGRPAALGRGLDTLMGNEEERDAPCASDATAVPESPGMPNAPEASDARSCRGHGHRHGHGACLVGGLIASGAAGAVAVAAFTLLGVRAVWAMGRR
ncbi:hypothetical protein GS424_009055 [Eggerthella guodeyinii]|uniref:Uncharacterized protein n=1 Tax=Eggerthella guodeyinii TaxID=2690837 RepID=A0A6L7IUT4_9ACTN|nr:hypothetical protein [Eggerthella guodeyinii]QOS66714.1 hypothetical protein GS424_009055 [Eggerthella guodeyinii]